jgi:hypothetical protein
VVDRVSVMKLKELEWTILKVQCRVPLLIDLISELFNTVLQPVIINTGFEDLLYLVFIVFKCTVEITLPPLLA